MPSRPGKEALYEQFAADGIRYMFGNPGTVEQGFLDALGSTDMQYVLALQETAALGIADGYARATGGPALVQLHTGVGLGNGIGMLYQSMRGHTPLVVVAGEAGVQYDSMDAQMAADLVGMARPVTKWATRVVHPESVLRVLRRAVREAMTPPRGPVFVALPMDVLDELTGEPVAPSSVPSRRVLPVPDEVERAADLLTSGRAVALVGDGISVSGAQDELTRLVELLDAPVYGVDCSEVCFDTTHRLWRGQTGHMFGAASAKALAEADTVLIAGTYVFPEVFPLLDNPFAGKTVVHVDLDTWEVAKNYPVDLGLVADPKPTLGVIAEAVARRRGDAQPTGAGEPPELTEPAEDAPLMAGFAYELGRQAPTDLVLFDEALTATPDLVGQLPPRRPGDYFLTRGGSLGVGIPGAIGAKLARPEAEVIGFTGDGGSMYTIQALWTAARYGIAARLVVCNNSRYKLLDDNIDQYWKERDIPQHDYPQGFDLSRPEIDFAGLARSLGVPAVRVEKRADVEEAVSRLYAEQGPFLVDLVTG